MVRMIEYRDERSWLGFRQTIRCLRCTAQLAGLTALIKDMITVAIDGAQTAQGAC